MRPARPMDKSMGTPYLDPDRPEWIRPVPRFCLRQNACTALPRRPALRGPGGRVWTPFKSRTSYFTVVLSRSITSCAPPSTMEVADTRVSLAFCWSSGMVSAPQLHMVERTLERVSPTLSFRLPA